MKNIQYILLCTFLSQAFCLLDRPRGVAISKSSFYLASETFVCLDGSQKIPFSRINDDYCDCPDASDEPGTSACPNGSFHCTNAGHTPLNVPSSRVNDGICDCCDGTDEFSQYKTCENSCREEGRAAREDAERERLVMQEGFKVYQDYAKQGFDAKQERESRLVELREQKANLDVTRGDLEEMKKVAEEPERLAKDAHKQAWQEEKRLRDIESEKENSLKAFAELDTNQDSLVSVEEMKTRAEFDIDAGGDVSDEEAKEHLEDKESVDAEQFQTDVWPNIKNIYVTTVPEQEHVARDAEEEAAAVVTRHEDVDAYDQLDDDEPGYYDDEDEEYGDDSDELDDEDSDDDMDEHYERRSGDGRADDATDDGMPDYDDDTKELIEASQVARIAFEVADNQLRDVDKQIKDMEDVSSMDLGDEQEFFPLKDNCYEYSDREYTYKLCPYSKASQRSKSGGSETSLGKWGKWAGPEDNQYSVMLFDNGQNCWNGPNRSVRVILKCGTTNEIVSAAEPNKCEYEFHFRTPAACSSVSPNQHPDHTEL